MFECVCVCVCWCIRSTQQNIPFHCVVWTDTWSQYEHELWHVLIESLYQTANTWSIPTWLHCSAGLTLWAANTKKHKRASETAMDYVPYNYNFVAYYQMRSSSCWASPLRPNRGCCRKMREYALHIDMEARENKLYIATNIDLAHTTTCEVVVQLCCICNTLFFQLEVVVMHPIHQRLLATKVPDSSHT